MPLSAKHEELMIGHPICRDNTPVQLSNKCQLRGWKPVAAL